MRLLGMLLTICLGQLFLRLAVFCLLVGMELVVDVESVGHVILLGAIVLLLLLSESNNFLFLPQIIYSSHPPIILITKANVLALVLLFLNLEGFSSHSEVIFPSGTLITLASVHDCVLQVYAVFNHEPHYFLKTTNHKPYLSLLRQLGLTFLILLA